MKHVPNEVCMSDVTCLTYQLITAESEYTAQICKLRETTDTTTTSPVPQLSWIDRWSTVNAFREPHPPSIDLILKSIICCYHWTWEVYIGPFLMKACLDEGSSCFARQYYSWKFWHNWVEIKLEGLVLYSGQPDYDTYSNWLKKVWENKKRRAIRK